MAVRREYLALALLAHVPGVAPHGSLVSPMSRNALDRRVDVNCAAYSCKAGTKLPSGTYGACVNVSHPSEPCLNGQAAFYYSQGCFIGCAECDHLSGRVQTDLCRSGKNRTIDPRFRTINRHAAPGSKYDIYRHNPWAAPGNAVSVCVSKRSLAILNAWGPVVCASASACGLALWPRGRHAMGRKRCRGGGVYQHLACAPRHQRHKPAADADVDAVDNWRRSDGHLVFAAKSWRRL
eukprot:COSAG05_NODE_2981_length_2437_cov_1.493584_1_plen_236_part_00